MKESLFKSLWRWPSKRITPFLFQLSISTIVLPVSEKNYERVLPRYGPHIKTDNYMLFHPRKRLLQLFRKKRLKHKYWKWIAYIVKVRKSFMPKNWLKFYFFGFPSRLLSNFFENSNETKATCKSLV